MIFLLAIYTIGLAFMVIGFVCASSHEQKEAKPMLTAVAYLFWPVSIVAMVVHDAWNRYVETHKGHSPLWILTRH